MSLSLQASFAFSVKDYTQRAGYKRISASSLQYVLKLEGVFTSVHQLSSAGLIGKNRGRKGQEGETVRVSAWLLQLVCKNQRIFLFTLDTLGLQGVHCK